MILIFMCINGTCFLCAFESVFQKVAVQWPSGCMASNDKFSVKYDFDFKLQINAL